MATFQIQDADVAAVYIRTGRAEKGTEHLRLAPYLLVTYDDGTSGIVPRHVNGAGNFAAQYSVQDLEVDRIEIYDGGDPFGGMSQFGAF